MAKLPPVELTFHYHAPPSKVFAALTTSKGLTTWLLAKAEIEPRVGTPFRFTWRGGYKMKGRVRSLEPPRKVSFDWIDRWGRGKTFETVARFELKKLGKGTVVVLTHKGFKSGKEWIALHAAIQSGWTYFLLNLRSVLEHGTDLRRSEG